MEPSCTDPDHATQALALREMRAAMDKYGFKVNDLKPMMRGPVARASNHPDECPICRRKMDGSK